MRSVHWPGDSLSVHAHAPSRLAGLPAFGWPPGISGGGAPNGDKTPSGAPPAPGIGSGIGHQAGRCSLSEPNSPKAAPNFCPIMIH